MKYKDMMDLIDALKFLVLLCLFSSCNVPKKTDVQHNVSNIWEQRSVEYLSDAYMDYKNKGYDTCWEKDRDMKFDYDRKVRVIRDFNYNGFIQEAKEYVDKRRIKLDSIVSVNYFYHPADEVEYPTYFIDFYLFEEGKIVRGITISKHQQKYKRIQEIRELNKAYNSAIRKKNGCDYGLVIITGLDQNWDCSIRSMAINPDNIYFE